MLALRLSLALESGDLELPETGRIAVIAPPVEADLSALPKDRVTVVSGFYPAHHGFETRGYEAKVTPEGPYALSILCLPRAKAEARAALAEIVPLTEGPVVIDGQKTDGVESVLKELRKRRCRSSRCWTTRK